jgi:hypothetical protein
LDVVAVRNTSLLRTDRSGTAAYSSRHRHKAQRHNYSLFVHHHSSLPSSSNYNPSTCRATAAQDDCELIEDRSALTAIIHPPCQLSSFLFGSQTTTIHSRRNGVTLVHSENACSCFDPFAGHSRSGETCLNFLNFSDS